ncbi:MAG: UDP-N-acetylmuramate--L-alanine ligase [Acidobacteriota bacterium]
MLGHTRRIHFVGIGGIGMSGIAELLANLGYEVSGSDAKSSEITERLSRLGVDVHKGHAEQNVGTADVVVVSSAIHQDNPEVVAARERHIPVIPRAEMLAELMRLQRGIAVAGAHGKTTTTSMIALVLERAGLDPTAVIGGRLSAFGSNAKLGRGAWIVAEADESDRSFLRLSPSMAVITNLDHEHMEAYGTFEELQRAFVEFANKVPFDGLVVACADDPALRAIMPAISRPTVTYALGETPADVTATDIALSPFASVSRVWLRKDDNLETLGELTLSVPGRHNVSNALAAIAVALELKIPFERVASALAEFHGAERRFQSLGERRGVLVVDDYGHHPTEIAAVLAAARTLHRRILVVFQPHRYTRTQQLMTEFGPALAAADEIVLTDIYAASEKPIPGVTLEALAEAVRRSAQSRHPGTRVHVIAALEELPRRVAALAREGDVVITLGAGSIGTVGRRLLEELNP